MGRNESPLSERGLCRRDILIFVTVGTQKFQFNRLLKEIDSLVEEGIISSENVFAQIGSSTYIPQRYTHKAFLTKEELNNHIKSSHLVITHGGTGSIINSLKSHKKVIGIPRDAKFGEHVDNHQYEIIDQFKNSSMIMSITDVKDLRKALIESETFKFKEYHSNSEKFNEAIQRYINEWM